jgi:hypothetical protein
MSKVLEDIVGQSGISPIFAKTVVKRALERAGIDPMSMRASDLEKALPELERALTVYLGDKAASDRIAAIKRSVGG